MNKAQEIQALKDFIASLPASTYIRPWLENCLMEVQDCIASDIFPCVTPEEIHKRQAAEIKFAENRAAEIVGCAQHKADRIVAEAEQVRKDAFATKEHVRWQIMKAAEAL